MKTYKSKIEKTYTKKQICEAIQHWESLLESEMDKMWQDFEALYKKFPKLFVNFEVNGKHCELVGVDKVGDKCVLVLKYGSFSSFVSGKEFLRHMLSSGLKASQVSYDKLYAEVDGVQYPFLDFDTHSSGQAATFRFIFDMGDNVESFFTEKDEMLDEGRHDGHWIPSHPARRNPSEKKTVYYVAVDYSDDFRNYGQYVRPDGSLTDDASNESFKHCGVTTSPEKALNMAYLAKQKYGNSRYVFVFHQPYTYGNQTHKNHARPAVIDIWYPTGKYWRYDLKELKDLV